MSFEIPKNFQPYTIAEEDIKNLRPLTKAEMQELGIGGTKRNLSPENENIDPILKTIFRNPETKAEQTIEINLEEKISEARSFYKNNFNLDINEAEIRSVWNRNYAEIKNEAEKYGYDSIVIVPENLGSEADVNKNAVETIDEGVGKGKVIATKYWAEQQSLSSIAENKYKIILVHSAQNLADQPFLKATKGKNIMTLTGLDQPEVARRIANGKELPANFRVEIGGQEIEIKADSLSIEEYEIFQRMYFEKTGKHLDESGWTWLMKSRSGSRVVDSGWHPGGRQLGVDAYDPGAARGTLGLRLSRSFS